MNYTPVEVFFNVKAPTKEAQRAPPRDTHTMKCNAVVYNPGITLQFLAEKEVSIIVPSGKIASHRAGHDDDRSIQRATPWGKKKKKSISWKQTSQCLFCFFSFFLEGGAHLHVLRSSHGQTGVPGHCSGFLALY